MFSQLTIAALAGLACAAPSATSASGFTINQVAGPDVVRSGPAALAKAYAKYNATIPTVPADAVSALQSGSVTAAPEQNDRSYLSPVSIGTPPQVLHMDFDTGSSDLWVFSNLLSSAQSKGHSVFNIGKSKTAHKRNGATWKISYADGSGASGVIYGDTVNIGGVKAKKQAVECATSVAASFASDTPNDGLVGLGGRVRNQASPKKVKPFFQNVAKSLPHKLFTTSLKAGKPGSYDFGYIDSKKYSGSISYVPIQRTSQGAGLYQFKASGYSVSGKQYNTVIDSIADTGTSLMLLPQGVVKNYYSAVSGAVYNSQVKGYIFPCASSLPAFVIDIGGAKHSVPGSYINYVFVGTVNSQRYCYGGIQLNSGLPFAILGDVFLKSVFAVFDVGNQRMGFAAQS